MYFIRVVFLSRMSSKLILCLLLAIVIPSTHAASVSPNPGYEGQSFRFSHTLSGDLPSGFLLKISLQGTDGNYLSNNTMSGGPRAFSYSRRINDAGNNRGYRIAIFEGTLRRTDWINGTYTVLGEPVLNGGVNIVDVSGGFRVNWNSASGSGVSYRLYRSESRGSLGSQIYSGSLRNYTDSNLISGRTYYYTARACNPAGCEDSNQDFKKYEIPAPVLSGGVNIVNISGGFNLNWNSASGSVSTYRLYRSTSNGVRGSQIYSGSNRSYADRSVSNGVRYYYTASACNASGCEDSNQDFKDYVAPPVLNGGVNIADAAGGFRLNWNVASGTVTNYQLYRSESSSSKGSLIYSGSLRNYTDTNLVTGRTYYYTASACNASGCEDSNQDFKRYLASPVLSGGVNIAIANGGFALNWNAATGDVSYYEVFRSESSGQLGSVIATVSGQQFIDTSLTIGRIYYYTVSACNSSGCDNSNQDYRVYEGQPVISGAGTVNPRSGFKDETFTFTKILTADLPGTFSLKLSLKGSDGAWLLDNVMNGGPRTFTYSRSIASPGVNREYRLAIFKGNTRQSDWQYGVYTVVDAPVLAGGVNIVPTNGGFDLNWNEATGIVNNYELYKSTVSGSKGVLVYSGSNTSYRDLDVVIGSTYYYTASACNPGGCEDSNQDFSEFDGRPVLTSAGTVTPDPGIVGSVLTFRKSISTDLPSGFSLQIAFRAGDAWLSNHVMSGGPRDFEYLRIISEAGVDREYRIGLFKAGVLVSDWQIGLYTVQEQPSDSEIKAYLSAGEPVVASILETSNVNRLLSRSEAAILLDTFLGKQNSSYKISMAPYEDPFADVNSSGVHYEPVKRLSYFEGAADTETVFTKENSSFRPLDKVTRQEFVKMIIQGGDFEVSHGNSYIQPFLDKDEVIGTIWERYFNTAVELQLIVGNDGNLNARDPLTIQESLFVFARTFGKTSHQASGFQNPLTSNSALLRKKFIGFDYIPTRYLPFVEPIDMTTVSQPTLTSIDDINCGAEDRNYIVLDVDYTIDPASNNAEYFWWQTNHGFFRQYGSDAKFSKVCFFPSLVAPTENYSIRIGGGDDIGYSDRLTISLDKDQFSYGGDPVSVDVPASQTLAVQYQNLQSYLRQGELYRLDLSPTVVKRSGVNIGLENVAIRLIGAGYDELVYSGPTVNGFVEFYAPERDELNGESMRLQVTAQTQQIQGQVEIPDIVYLPRYTVSGVLFNVDGYSAKQVRIGGEIVPVDERNMFYLELDSTNQVEQVIVEVVSSELGNVFESQSVTIGAQDPVIVLSLYATDTRDADNDGVFDSYDNCLGLANPGQDDSDFDNIGDACDSNDDSLIVSSLEINGADSVNEDSSSRYSAIAKFNDGTSIDVTTLSNWLENSEVTVIEAPANLIAGSVSVDQLVSIDAAYSYEGVTVVAEKTVSVKNVSSGVVVTSLNIVGPDQIIENDIAQFSASATFSDGAVLDVTNSVNWQEDSPVADVNDSGQLDTYLVSDTQTFTLSISFVYAGVTTSATKSVEIFDTPAEIFLSSIDIVGASSINEKQAAKFNAIALLSNEVEEDISNEVAWSVNSTLAEIDSAGMLSVGDVSSDTDIIISASYTFGDITKTSTHTLTVIDVPLMLSSINLTGLDSINEQSTVSYTASAFYTDGAVRDITSLAVWSDNSSLAQVDAAGNLSVGDVLSDSSVLISISYTEGDVTKTSNKLVNIIDVPVEPPLLTSIKIFGPSDLINGRSAQYRLIGVFDNNTESQITSGANWSVIGPNATIDQDGVLQTGVLEAPYTLTVIVSYNDGTPFSASISITVRPKLDGAKAIPSILHLLFGE